MKGNNTIMYDEIIKLHKLLNDANIPNTLQPQFDGWQIIYSCDGKKRIADVIEHRGSYGADENLLEIMGLLTEDEKADDDVLGYLTAENVFERIYKHWEANKQ